MCPEDTECPFNGICLDKDVLYEAELTSSLRNYGKKHYKDGLECKVWKPQESVQTREIHEGNRAIQGSLANKEKRWKFRHQMV